MKTILLTLVMCGAVLGQERSDEWKASRADAWRIMQEEYPWMWESHQHAKTVELLKDYDEWARVNRPKFFNDPYKELSYLRHHVEGIAMQYRAAAQAREAELAAQEREDQKKLIEAAKIIIEKEKYRVEKIPKMYQPPKNDGYHMRR